MVYDNGGYYGDKSEALYLLFLVILYDDISDNIGDRPNVLGWPGWWDVVGESAIQ